MTAAFKLSPREFESYEISQSVDDVPMSDDANDPTDSIDSKKVRPTFLAWNLVKATNRWQKFESRIPRFRVDDDSSVTVVETKNAFEKSCADSSFLEASFQMAG